jgi:hypothetical protein
MTSTTTHTADTLAALIASRIEPDAAERVLTALTAANGQLITTRLLDKLPGGRVEWRMRREMGNTSIRNRAYLQSRGDSLDALDLTLASSESSVPLDVSWVEQQNSYYFAERRKRNADRAEAVQNRAMLGKLAIIMNEIVDLRHRLAVAKTAFVAFVDTGTPCYPDRYELERACGLREENR